MSNANDIIDHLNKMANHRSISLDKTNDLKKMLIADYGDTDISILDQAFGRMLKREYLSFNDIDKGVKLHRLPTFTEYQREIDGLIADAKAKQSLNELVLTPVERQEMKRVWRLGNMRMRYIKFNNIDESNELYDVIFDGKYDNVILKWEQDNDHG